MGIEHKEAAVFQAAESEKLETVVGLRAFRLQRLRRAQSSPGESRLSCCPMIIFLKGLQGCRKGPEELYAVCIA